MASTIVSRGKKVQHYTPTPAEVAILRGIALFHYLTVEQVIRLLEYKDSMITTVRPRLKELYLHKYCERRALPMPPIRRGGSAAYVYLLGKNGRTFVKDVLEMEVPARYRPTEIPKPNQLAHIVACVDVYISAYLLAKRRRENVRQEHLIVERTLRGLGEKVTVDGHERRVTPDGFWSVIVREGTEGFRAPFILEVDMGTEKQDRWREKVRGLLAWWDSPQYRERFGTIDGQIAVVSPGKPNHAEVLREWTEAELVELGRRRLGEHFLFTGTDPAKVGADEFFPGRIWRQAFKSEPVAALELGEPVAVPKLGVVNA